MSNDAKPSEAMSDARPIPEPVARAIARLHHEYTPAQYHAIVDRMWAALGITTNAQVPDGKDVWTLIEERLAEVQRLREEAKRDLQALYDEYNNLEAELFVMRAKLAIYEPPEGERDHSHVCRVCGYNDEQGCRCEGDLDNWESVERWRYLAAQKLMEGEK